MGTDRFRLLLSIGVAAGLGLLFVVLLRYQFGVLREAAPPAGDRRAESPRSPLDTNRPKPKGATVKPVDSRPVMPEAQPANWTRSQPSGRTEPSGSGT